MSPPPPAAVWTTSSTGLAGKACPELVEGACAKAPAVHMANSAALNRRIDVVMVILAIFAAAPVHMPGTGARPLHFAARRGETQCAMIAPRTSASFRS
jgi:hypothetical protein